MLLSHGGHDRFPLDADGLLARAPFTLLRSAEREMCAVAYLSADGVLLGTRTVEGTRSWVEVPVRTIAADALTLDAAQVVMAHNHPGGDPTPSAGDLSYTRRLAQGLEALGTRLFDHLVVGRGVVSMRARGLL